MRRLLASIVMATIVVLAGGTARGEELFEIQVFHARVTTLRAFGLELHTNYAGAGATYVEPPEASTSGVLYSMLEPTYGVAENWEVGLHLQQAIRPDGVVDWGGVKARAMVLFTSALSEEDGFHAALSVESGYQPARFDEARWSTELRPVLEWTSGAFDLDVNPMFVFPWGGEHPAVPHFAPAASVRVAFADVVAPGVEYYADFGSLSAVPSLPYQWHYIYQTLDVIAWRDWILHAGVGEGMTSASTKWLVTTMIGLLF